MKYRGNIPYAYYKKSRMQEIQHKLNQFVKIDDSSTNGIMITLTIDPSTIKTAYESWIYMKKNIPVFLRKLKVKLPIQEYIYNKEAHNSGYCHSHIFLVLEKNVVYDFIDRSGNPRNRKITKTIKDLWNFNSDILLAQDKNLSQYITLEIGKYTEIETALQSADKGHITANQQKAIYTHYYANKTCMRLYIASRGLSCDNEKDREIVDCLDYYKTNSTRIVVSYCRLCNILGRRLPPYTIFKPPPNDKRKLIAFIRKIEKSHEQIQEFCVF